MEASIVPSISTPQLESNPDVDQETKPNSDLSSNIGTKPKAENVKLLLTVKHEFRSLWSRNAREVARTNAEVSKGSEELSGEKCRLEAAFLDSASLDKPRSRVHDVADFYRWAIQENARSSLHTDIGSVQSVHLFRERKAPLHHEFALLCFSGGISPPSWLRVERAARVKERWSRIQADSFGPLFQGVPTRESVSFGCSKEVLAGNQVDEVGFVSIGPSESTTGIREPLMLLHELASNLRSISRTFPSYKLLQTNCRWFARRVLLSFAQRLVQGMFSHHAALFWRDSPISFEGLHEKIQRERFGGKELEGEDSDLVRAAGLLDLAGAALDDRRAAEALDICESAIKSVQSRLDVSSYRRQMLMASCLNMRSLGSLELERHQEALLDAEESCRISRVWRGEEGSISESVLGVSLSNLAECYSRVSQGEDAVVAQEEAILVWRKLIEDSPSKFKFDLASALNALARYLSELNREEAATKTNKEALSHYRELHRRRPDLYGWDLATSLSDHAHYLWNQEAWGEGCLYAEEGIRVREELSRHQPEPNQRLLAPELYHWAISLHQAGQPDKAIEAQRRAVDAYRIFHVSDAKQYEIPLATALSFLAQLLGIVDEVAEAYELGEESLGLYRSIHDASPGVLSTWLPDALSRQAAWAAAYDDWESACDFSAEGVARRKELFAANPDSHRHELADDILTWAQHFEGAGRFPEAIETAQEALEHYRILSRQSARSDEEKFQADGYVAKCLEYLATFLSRTRDYDGAVAASREALVFRRLQHAKSQDDESIASTLSTSLYAQAIYLGKAGRYGDAIDIGTEGIEIRLTLCKTDPEEHRPQLAPQMHSLSRHLFRAARFTETVTAGRSTLAHFRILHQIDPSNYQDSLVECLDVLINALTKLELDEEMNSLISEKLLLTESEGSENGSPEAEPS